MHRPGPVAGKGRQPQVFARAAVHGDNHHVFGRLDRTTYVKQPGESDTLFEIGTERGKPKANANDCDE